MSRQNQLKIIGGSHRSRVVSFPDKEDLRPTGNRVRETLFNWLQLDIVNANCLDLFAGTGVLSFEALSRGAEIAVAVESSRLVAKSLQRNCEILGAQGLILKNQRAEEFLSSPPDSRFDLVFADPPFGRQLAIGACEALQHNGWLNDSALIYVETARTEDFNAPDSWNEIRHKQAGNVVYRLFEAG